MLQFLGLIPASAYRVLGVAAAILFAIWYIRNDAIHQYRMAAQLAVQAAEVKAQKQNQELVDVTKSEIEAARRREADLQENLRLAQAEISAAKEGSECKLSRKAVRTINRAR